MLDSRDDYLSWFKNEAPRWRAKQCIDLAGSAVAGNESSLDELIHAGRNSSADMMWGHADLRETVANFVGILEGPHTPRASCIVPTSGASSAMFIALFALRRLLSAKGMKPLALVEAPTYRPLYSVCAYLDYDMSTFRRSALDGYRLHADALRAALADADQPVVVVVSNPNNPTSAESSVAEMQSLLIAAPAGSYLLVDETFRNAGNLRESIAALRDPRLVALGSLSKDPGLFSLRCGWIAAFGQTLDEIRQAWVHAHNIGSPITESAACAALREIETFNRRTVPLLAANRSIAEKAFAPLRAEGLISGETPKAGCVMFPELTTIQAEKTFDARRAKLREFYKAAVDQAGVAIVPGDLFNPAAELDAGEANIRIGIGGSSDDLREGLDRLSHFVREFSRR